MSCWAARVLLDYLGGYGGLDVTIVVAWHYDTKVDIAAR